MARTAGAGLCERKPETSVETGQGQQGAAGVDCLDIEKTAEHLLTQCVAISEQPLSGVYGPSPVRRVVIPKPDGGEHELGFPAVTERLMQ